MSVLNCMLRVCVCCLTRVQNMLLLCAVEINPSLSTIYTPSTECKSGPHTESKTPCQLCRKPFNVRKICAYSTMGEMVRNLREEVNWMPLSICSQCVRSRALPWSGVSKGVPFTVCRNRYIACREVKMCSNFKMWRQLSFQPCYSL